jgi:hypothetical protein
VFSEEQAAGLPPARRRANRSCPVARDAFDSPSESVDKISRFGLAADGPTNGLDTLKDLLKSVGR